MPRSIFISYQHKDRHAKELLKAQADNKNIDLSLTDRSPNRSISSKWKIRMKNRIEESSTTVVIIAEDTHKSKAVNREIEQNRKSGNKIIGIQINPAQHHRLPPAMNKSEELRR